MSSIPLIQRRLFDLCDEKYRNFHSRLMPTVDERRVIGVRVPCIRKLAKEISGTPEAQQFTEHLPHDYYEENNLHAFLIEGINDFNSAVSEIERFLPFVDNWATCDSMTPKVFAKHPDQLLPYIYKWLKSNHTYTVRFAIGMLMKFFLDKNFDPSYPEMVSSVRSDEYYVNMMIAWYFATALAKQYDYAVAYLTDHRLEKWVHNKTIQKAVESYRIPDNTKSYLRTLRIK